MRKMVVTFGTTAVVRKVKKTLKNKSITLCEKYSNFYKNVVVHLSVYPITGHHIETAPTASYQ